MKSIFEVKILGIVAAVCAFIYLLFSYFNPERGMDNLAPGERLSLKKNIIVLGVDERAEEHDVGRSDTLFVVMFDTKNKAASLLSVPRDTRVRIKGHGWDKINHAYAYGGAELSMSMLNTNLDLDITEFATVDFGVLAKIIDAVGGIDLDISDAEYSLINPLIDEQNSATGSDSEHISGPGYQHVNGTQATAYARIRKIDSDFKRAERQRIVLSKVFEEAKSANIGTLLNIIDTILPEVYTNMTSTDLISLAKDIFNYNIADQTGWPFEKETGSLPSDGLSYVFADSLEQNVTELHEYLFDNEDYTPSSTVSDISYELYCETGY